jgi:hypothetical protein
MLLTGAMAVGLAVGLGVLTGIAHSEEAGAAAGMLAVAMPGVVLLSERITRWFGVKYGPRWAGRMIQLTCGAPLLAIGAAPAIDAYGDSGVALWLGLLAVAVLANWERQLDNAAADEVSFGTAVWTAFGGLVATAIAFALLNGHEEELMFLAAGVAGISSLVIQASGWWRFAPIDAVPPLPGVTAHTPVTAPQPAAPRADVIGTGPAPAYAQPGAEAYGPQVGTWHRHTASGPGADGIEEWKARWLVTRAFWALVAFASMGGSIFLFVVTLIATDWHYHERTGAIIGCIGLAAWMLFAIRKTGPVKRAGFWRETLRPFLISASMFGIGAAITGISREWHHSEAWGLCVPDEGKAGLVTGLVLSSLLFGVLILFTGRRRNPSEQARGNAEVLESTGMTRALPWTPEEFDTVLRNPEASDEELATLLETRSTGAIGIVREGIHAYHRGMNASMLSAMMQDRLGDRSRRVRCPRCDADV